VFNQCDEEESSLLSITGRERALERTLLGTTATLLIHPARRFLVKSFVEPVTGTQRFWCLGEKANQSLEIASTFNEQDPADHDFPRRSAKCD
jgi:hypothetical protein